MTLRKYIPNTITSLNLVCGVLGVMFTFNGRPDIAFYMMLAAAAFDFLDGLAARALDAYSDIGTAVESEHHPQDPADEVQGGDGIGRSESTRLNSSHQWKSRMPSSA